jgi:two-component system, NarL family, invasion response regulator UvrY
MIKILIADDHELIREGLKKVIRKEVDMKIVGEAIDATDILRQIRDKDVDIIILDLNLPGRSGLDVLKDIILTKPDIKVIILSINPENLYAKRAFNAGAWGYITKDKPASEIIIAIRRVVNGKKYIVDTFEQAIFFDTYNTSNKPKHEQLSDRETDVLRLLAKGNTIKAIAKNLNLSTSSINTYRLRVLEKLGLKTNTDLIYYAIQNGVTEFDLLKQ